MNLSINLRCFSYSLFILWSTHVLSGEVSIRRPSHYRVKREEETYTYTVDPSNPNAEYANFIVKVLTESKAFTGVISGTSCAFSDPSIYNMKSVNVCLLNGKCEEVHEMNLYKGTYFTLMIIGEHIGEQTEKTDQVVDALCFAVGINHAPEEVKIQLREDFSYHVTSEKPVYPNDAIVCDGKQAGILRPGQGKDLIMESSLRMWAEAQVLPKWYIAAIGLLGELERMETSTLIARRSLSDASQRILSSFLTIALTSFILHIV